MRSLAAALTRPWTPDGSLAPSDACGASALLDQRPTPDSVISDRFIPLHPGVPFHTAGSEIPKTGENIRALPNGDAK